MSQVVDVLVVGAGPTGLACGIEAQRAGLKPLLLEKGCLVNSLFNYSSNMTFFTTRERLEIGDIPFSSVNVKPTRAEALEYYRQVADHYDLPIRYDERVVGIESAGDYFQVHSEQRTYRHTQYEARNVIIATGYYDLPNMLGIPGESLPKVSHYAQEPHAFYRRKVAIIGGANSAAVTALDLYRHGAEVTIIYRGAALSRHIKYWIKPDLENRIKEGSIRALFESAVIEIREDCILVLQGPANGTGRPSDEHEAQEQQATSSSPRVLRLENDYVFALTGYHPDIDLLRGAGVNVDAVSYRPDCNPDTLESNSPGVYLAGVVISGFFTNEIFIENGRFHGRQIIRHISAKA